MVRQASNPKELCPRCAKGKLVTDNESGEMFCSKCGFVLSEKIQESGPEWRSFTQDEHGDRARAGAPTSLTMHDMGLATIINPVNKDASGRPLTASMKSTIERLRTWDVEQAANIKRKDIARCYRLLVKELDLKMPVTDSIQCVARIASRIGIAEKTKRYAIKVLKDAQENEVSAGKDPMGLAAAALYLSCVKNGEDKTQRDIAEAANVTEVTIRNRYKGLKDSLNI